MTRIPHALAGTLAVLMLATPVHAQLNACAAAKKLCVAKKVAALLKCHSKNEKPPAGLDPVKFANCIQKAKDKFDGGANPAKGCFAKLEAKFGAGCITSNDTVALETQADDFVDAVVCALDPGAGTCPAAPTPTPTSTPACLALGQSCAMNNECCSSSCMGGTCVASCSNGIQDGNETGVDCGGSCAPCGLGGGCSITNDCVPTTQCSAGQCVCAAGQADCNGFPGDGCEASTASDVTNCGACGNMCSFPNTMAGCVAGQCTIGTCSAGYADCDSLLGDGCEIFLAGDPNNCGGCGNVCSFPHTTAGCAASQCTVGMCNAGYANCNNVTGDGCEVNTANDPNNCGGCGNVCSNPLTCVSGICQ